MYQFHENDVIYYVAGEYPNQIIESGTIEFFFDHTSIINDITHIEQLACILTDNRMKCGRSVSSLFPTAEAARKAINAGLDARRERYRAEIQDFDSAIRGIAEFALKHNVSNDKNDPIAREVILEYCNAIGINITEN